MSDDGLYGDLVDELRPMVREEMIRALRVTGASQEWLTVKDICDFLGVSRSTVNRWREEGKLVAHKLGGRVYFRTDSLSTMMRLERQRDHPKDDEPESDSDEESEVTED